MFGLSFGELVVIVIVAIVAIGPKDMPKVLRKAGQWAGRLRRMASDLRAQSGIDDALRIEGISEDIQEIRKLARGELDAVQRAAAPNDVIYQEELRRMEDSLLREREYPREGADGYDAVPVAPHHAEHPLPMSVWARNPLYALGDETAELPPLPEGQEEPTAPPAGPTLAEESLASGFSEVDEGPVAFERSSGHTAEPNGAALAEPHPTADAPATTPEPDAEAHATPEPHATHATGGTNP